MAGVWIRIKPEPYCPECGGRMELVKPENPASKAPRFWRCLVSGCYGRRRAILRDEDQPKPWEQVAYGRA